MNEKPIRILLLEDNPGDARLVRDYLHEDDLVQVELDHVVRLRTGLEHLTQGKPDVILLDLGLPDSQGLETFTQVYAQAPEVPIIILTGLNDTEQAVEAVRAGAQDYLVKGEVCSGLLLRAIRYAIERHRAATQMTEHHALLNTILESADTPIFSLDRDYRYTSFNRAHAAAMRTLYGAEIDIGHSLLEYQTVPEDRENARRNLGQVLRGEALVESTSALEPGRAPRYYTVRHNPIRNTAGEVIGLSVFASDITERKQAEQALADYSARLEADVARRTQELRDAQEQLVRQEKLAALGQLAGSVAHELRNPLGVITNAVYYLNAVQPDAEAAILDYLGLIAAEANNADKIISDLLDFARLKGVHHETVNLAVLVRGVLQKHPPAADITVVSECLDALPPVYVDPRQIEQVLTNLVVNACQAMPEGGSLTLRAELVGEPLAAGPEPSGVALQVVDTGTGISPENIKKLFEPLFTTKAKGIGLGLAVSKKLIEANGGRLEVQSELGKGSTFTAWLPLQN